MAKRNVGCATAMQASGQSTGGCVISLYQKQHEIQCTEESIFRAYELVPEAYQQKFRNHKKSNGQTYVEFAREKAVLFDKWCTASEVKKDFEALRQLILLEDFKNLLMSSF